MFGLLIGWLGNSYNLIKYICVIGKLGGEHDLRRRNALASLVVKSRLVDNEDVWSILERIIQFAGAKQADLRRFVPIPPAFISRV